VSLCETFILVSKPNSIGTICIQLDGDDDGLIGKGSGVCDRVVIWTFAGRAGEMGRLRIFESGGHLRLLQKPEDFLGGAIARAYFS